MKKIIITHRKKEAQGSPENVSVPGNEGAPGNKVVDVEARYIADGYLAYAAYIEDVEHGDNYWPDYYDSDHNPDESETVLLRNVPIDLAEKLVAQGSAEQVFSDGYEAASAAAPYIEDSDPDRNQPTDYEMDTPLGQEYGDGFDPGNLEDFAKSTKKIQKKAFTGKEAGKYDRGKRDGTGPYIDSHQRKKQKEEGDEDKDVKGKRKNRGEECPCKQEEKKAFTKMVIESKKNKENK